MKKIKIIEAGAGSGKTHRLANEVFDALTRKNSPIRPDGFILTTFTRKAAAELLSRVSKWLIEKGKTSESQLVRQSLIGTVNSVCGTLLQRFAFEAGLSTRMRVVPEGEAQGYFNNVLSAVIKAGELEDLYRLAQMLSVDDWRAEILALVNIARSNYITGDGLRAMAADSVELATGFLPKPQGNASACINEVREAIKELDKIIRSGQDTTKSTSNAAEALREFVRMTETNRVVPWQEFHKLSGIGAGKRSGADALLNNVRLLANTHHTWPEFKNSISDYLHLVFGIASRSMDAYAEWKRSEELIDFVDQEVLILQTLDVPEVGKTLSEELDLVLVDEFQDTSPIQLAVFLKLAECAKESVWVGDPKQAIYGFRNADPELMFAAIDSITKQSSGKKIDRLEKSYRSVKPLVEFVNDTFGEKFGSQHIPKDRVTLKAVRTDTSDTAPLESWVITSTNQDGDASSIAGRISAVLSSPEKYPVFEKETKRKRPIRPRDIAVLCRVNDACDQVAKQLANAGIPVERAACGLLKEPEIQMIVAGMKLLIDSNDTLASAKVSYFTDVVRNGGKEEKWLEDRIKEAADKKTSHVDKQQNALSDHPIIKRILEKSTNMEGHTPLSTLHMAANLTDAWEFAAAMDNPQKRIANINRLFAYGEEYEENCVASGRPLTSGGLLQFFDELTDSKNDRIAASGGDAVRVMTWHGSKGLEWPMVVLYTLDSRPYNRLFGVNALTAGKFSIDSPVANRAIQYVPFPYNWKSRSKAEYYSLMQAQDAFEKAQAITDNEWIRLLYVVFTRARDYLVFAARTGKISALEHNGLPLFKLPQDPADIPKGWKVVPISPLDSAVQSGKTLVKWFPYQSSHTERPDAVVNPSRLEVSQGKKEMKIEKSEKLWEPMQVQKDADKEIIGSAIHAYLAVDTSKMQEKDKQEIAERIICAHDLENILDPKTVVNCGVMIDKWISQHWAGVTRHREWPIVMVKDGFTIEGQADVVLESDREFSIIDYKTATGSQEDLKRKAESFFPQVSTYAEAVSLATGKTCKDMVICFPLAGVAVFLKK